MGKGVQRTVVAKTLGPSSLGALALGRSTAALITAAAVGEQRSALGGTSTSK